MFFKWHKFFENLPTDIIDFDLKKELFGLNRKLESNYLIKKLKQDVAKHGCNIEQRLCCKNCQFFSKNPSELCNEADKISNPCIKQIFK